LNTIQGGIAMQDVIKKIIEIDKMAQKLTDEAFELKKEAEVSIEIDKKLLREQYIEKAHNRIALNTETEQAYLNQSLNDIEKKHNEIEARLKNIDVENRKKWVDDLYCKVIGE
jgi:seryl-tRNA synthetase